MYACLHSFTFVCMCCLHPLQAACTCLRSQGPFGRPRDLLEAPARGSFGPAASARRTCCREAGSSSVVARGGGFGSDWLSKARAMGLGAHVRQGASRGETLRCGRVHEMVSTAHELHYNSAFNFFAFVFHPCERRWLCSPRRAPDGPRGAVRADRLHGRGVQVQQLRARAVLRGEREVPRAALCRGPIRRPERFMLLCFSAVQQCSRCSVFNSILDSMQGLLGQSR